jgi:hypothetical protein
MVEQKDWDEEAVTGGGPPPETSCSACGVFKCEGSTLIAGEGPLARYNRPYKIEDCVLKGPKHFAKFVAQQYRQGHKK